MAVVSATSTGTHTGDDYYVSVTGTIQQQSNPIAAAALKLAGYVGPYDWADAKTKASENLGAKVGQAAGAAVGDAVPGTGANQGTRSGAAETGSSAGSDAEDALKDVLTLSGVSGKYLAIRGAKIIIGGILVIVAFAKLTDLDNKVAKAAVKAAPLL